MRCKHCGGEIIEDHNGDFSLWMLISDYPDDYWYTCYNNNNDYHEPEDKSDNFKLIYDILNETD